MIKLSYVGKTTDRDNLYCVWNAWLDSDEIKKAKEIALHGTDEECSLELKRLEDLCNQRMNNWRKYS